MDMQTNKKDAVITKKVDFLRKMSRLIVEEVILKQMDPGCKVLNFEYPEKLRERIDLSLPKEGVTDEALLNLCRKTIQYSVRTGHPNFHNQLFAGVSYYGVAASWLSDAINTSVYTYEMGPVFSLMESEFYSRMAKLVGYETFDGIFCPGGSASNLYGVNVARYHLFPQVKTQGLHAAPKLCLFASTQAHYSIKKAVAVLGLGLDNLILVPCDDVGRMDPEKLEKAVQEAKDRGLTPYFVHATSGTTVAGAYDPLDALSDVCRRHNMWLHVDACWGGGALLSTKYKQLLKGIERSDSIAWNPHKMVGVPQQCSVFLCKYKDLLLPCNSSQAKYLFQKDKFYDISYDTGDKSLQCGRKIDIFKLWLMWKAKGDNGLEKEIDNLFDCAAHLRNKLAATEGFRLVFEKQQCTNVCFWYIPPSLRGQEETPEWWQKLAKVAPIIKERMMLAGTLMMAYQPLEDRVNFFRMIVASTETHRRDMDFVVDEIQRLGSDIAI